MLPSSSGLGRQPPQAGNGGSNPSGSAIPLCPCKGPLSCFGGSSTSLCRLLDIQRQLLDIQRQLTEEEGLPQ